MIDNELAQKVHRKFSSSAHNTAMDILYSDEPTQEEIHSLMELTHVAHWHWMRRDDKKPQNVSVALWALSRAYSANGYGERAFRYAKESLETIDSEDLLPSFYAYSHEALARAYILLDDEYKARQHYDEALKISEQVPDKQATEYLLDQINRIEL